MKDFYKGFLTIACIAFNGSVFSKDLNLDEATKIEIANQVIEIVNIHNTKVLQSDVFEVILNTEQIEVDFTIVQELEKEGLISSELIARDGGRTGR